MCTSWRRQRRSSSKLPNCFSSMLREWSKSWPKIGSNLSNNPQLESKTKVIWVCLMSLKVFCFDFWDYYTYFKNELKKSRWADPLHHYSFCQLAILSRADATIFKQQDPRVEAAGVNTFRAFLSNASNKGITIYSVGSALTTRWRLKIEGNSTRGQAARGKTCAMFDLIRSLAT